jgi:platelet-activating factor acetylhydrolase isoform II
MRKVLKGLAISGALTVFAIGALVGSLWVERRSELTLPTPTGPFTVGRTFDVWSDAAAFDALAPIPGTKRELLVWIWYPSSATQSTAMDDYVPEQLRPKPGSRRANVFTFLTRDASKVHEHSARDSGVSAQQRSYPVAMMRGGASTSVLNYSTLAEDLASHGYVVVGFDAPYRTGVVVFPDGRTIRETPENNPELCVSRDHVRQERCATKIVIAWTSDMGFVLDRLERLNKSDSSNRFTGRLDLTRVGVFGHSLGGAEAAQFCHDDSRCKAGIDIDGAPHGSVIGTGMRQPFMFLLSDHGDASDAESRQIWSDIQSIYDRLPLNGRLRVAIRGANHFTFSDDGALLKSRILRGALRLFGLLGIDGRRQLAVTAYCVRTFFDAYLKGARSSPLRISSPLYAEIQVLP